MAEITDIQAVTFSNEKLRVAADSMLTDYRTAKQLVLDYYVDASLGTIYTDQSGDFIADRSDVDGRTRVTGNDALLMVTRASELIAELEANSNAKLNVVLKYATNGKPMF